MWLHWWDTVMCCRLLVPKKGIYHILVRWISCLSCLTVARLIVGWHIAYLLHIWWWRLGAVDYVLCVAHVWIVGVLFWCIQAWINRPPCVCNPNLRWCQCIIVQPIPLWLCSFLLVLVWDGVSVLCQHISRQSRQLPMWIGLGAICDSINLEPTALVIPSYVESLLQKFIDQQSWLWEPVHASVGLDVHHSLAICYVSDLYSTIISLGMSLTLMRINSGHFSGVIR